MSTIAEIRKLTGVNFLPGLPEAKRTAMENFKAGPVAEGVII